MVVVGRRPSYGAQLPRGCPHRQLPGQSRRRTPERGNDGCSIGAIERSGEEKKDGVVAMGKTGFVGQRGRCPKHGFVLAMAKRPRHWLHIILTFFTYGLWAIVWVIVCRKKDWRCPVCKKKAEAIPGAEPVHIEPYSSKKCPECYTSIHLEVAVCEKCGKKQIENDSTCAGGVTSARDAQAYFTQERAKAKQIDSPGYIWRTSMDGSVCERCASKEGRAFSWDKEPPGGHAGAKARCTCYPEPIMPSA